MKLIPAHAGVILVSGSLSSPQSTYPRACGGDPVAGHGGDFFWYLSPRMRG